MNKYIINFVIGFIGVGSMTAFLILLTVYPVIGYAVFLPLIAWGCYYIGMVIRELWEDRRANRSTRM